MAGLWGVVVTDFLQFAFAMGGTIALAWFVVRVPAIGGLDGLVRQVPEATLAFVPDFSFAATAAASLSAGAFLTYLGVQWWASWYPGQEPGGGGYIAQRMMSARTERDALAATLWFTIAHYCVRPWPWILVGLATLVLYPNAVDKEAAYVLAMRDHLGPGWRGLLLGAFFAAYMSTISSQLNWGTSYLVSDVYKRFVRTDGTEAHYVWVSRLTTLLLMALSAVVTFYLESIRQAWEFVLESGAGIGLVLMLRWYWWRVNAWSEIVAMIAAAIGFALVRMATDWVFPLSLVAVVAWTTAWWLLVTWLTPPEPDATLDAFYARVSPPGPGWAPVAARLGRSPSPIGPLVGAWLAGTAPRLRRALRRRSPAAPLAHDSAALLRSGRRLRMAGRPRAAATIGVGRTAGPASAGSVALLRRRAEEGRRRRPGRRRIRGAERARRSLAARLTSAGRRHRLSEAAAAKRIRAAAACRTDSAAPAPPNGFWPPRPKGFIPPGCAVPPPSGAPRRAAGPRRRRPRPPHVEAWSRSGGSPLPGFTSW